jgi:hypothetical protein
MAIGGIRGLSFRSYFNFTNISVAFVTAGKDYFYLTTIPRSYNCLYKIFNFTTFPWVTVVFRMYSQIIIGSQIQSAVTTKSSAPVIFSSVIADARKPRMLQV